MTGIREILARNFKINRQKLGLTQEQLAEKANVSTHYIAMIETCNKYPKPEMLERLAKALMVEPHQLFSVSGTLDESFERLHQAIVTDMKQIVRETIQETIAENCKAKDRA
ncbi:MAG: helix-turn-helix domain-containing protein [Spirochaetaceae bacterium]|jgi:transcriptional regulator with XRE-family HTH domain|nr:helix-turn-helix domain-containing protein [Spirochaetaceae bacterium]